MKPLVLDGGLMTFPRRAFDHLTPQIPQGASSYISKEFPLSGYVVFGNFPLDKDGLASIQCGIDFCVRPALLKLTARIRVTGRDIAVLRREPIA
jgi:hypothetical protein